MPCAEGRSPDRKGPAVAVSLGIVRRPHGEEEQLVFVRRRLVAQTPVDKARIAVAHKIGVAGEAELRLPDGQVEAAFAGFLPEKGKRRDREIVDVEDVNAAPGPVPVEQGDILMEAAAAGPAAIFQPVPAQGVLERCRHFVGAALANPGGLQEIEGVPGAQGRSTGQEDCGGRT